MHIVAREKELKILNQLYDSGRAEFLAIYGRRRVGKTYLIREFFKNKGVFFFLTGVKEANTRKQLRNFSAELERVFGAQSFPIPHNWSEAFSQLRKAIEHSNTSERIILFFDELPWLASPRSGFLQDLDHFWNRYMSMDHRVIMIVCGSAASWMIRKVIRNKGGLYGRLTAQIRLLPFDLKETEEFLQYHHITLNRRSIIDLYMTIGGIPKYLSYVRPGQSAMQTINHICFNGPLTDEFDELYASLFEHHDRHVSIVKALAKYPGGLTKSEIADRTKLSPGGGMNMILDELEQSGFILSLKDFGKQTKDMRFKLIDEYSLFHLKWKEKAQESNLKTQNDNFWISLFNSPAGHTWAGYAFEMLCFKHLPKIKHALGISGVLTHASGWTFKPHKELEGKGTQIDLLIDRADNCINLCEIKYCNEEFVITKSYDKELREKKSIFLTQTQSKKSVFITLITPYGVKKNGYNGTAEVSLIIDSLF